MDLQKVLFKKLLFFLVFSLLSYSGINQVTQVVTNYDDLFLTAQANARDGDYDGARRLCATIINGRPNYAEARILMGRTYAWEKNYDLARTTVSTVFNTYDQSTENGISAIKALADIEFWDGNFTKSLEWCDKGLQYFPDDKDLNIKRAKVLLQTNKFGEAKAIINYVLKDDPNNSEALGLNKVLFSDDKFNTAQNYARNGNYSKSRSLCTDILKTRPNYAEPRILMGRTYAWEKNYDLARTTVLKVFNYHNQSSLDGIKAIKALADIEFWSANYAKSLEWSDKGLSYYPGDNELKIKRAKVLLQSNKYDEATTIINNVLKREPNNIEARQLNSQLYSGDLFKTAQSHAQNGDYSNSRSICNQILRNNPNHAEARILLGRTYAWEKNYDLARTTILRVFNYYNQSSINGIEAIKALSDVEFWDGNFQKSLEWCDKGLQYARNDVDLLNKRAKVLLRTGNFVEAKTMLDRELLANPDNFEALEIDNLLYNEIVDIARAYSVNEEYEKSRTLCRYVLNNSPENASARIHLGNTYAWTNNYDSARIVINKVFDNHNKPSNEWFEAMEALINVEFWSGYFNQSIRYCNECLLVLPEVLEYEARTIKNEELLIKKARALREIGEFFEAKKNLFIVLKENKNNVDALSLYNDLQNSIRIPDYQIKNRDFTEFQYKEVDDVNRLYNQAYAYAWIKPNQIRQQFQKEFVIPYLSMYPTIKKQFCC